MLLKEMSRYYEKLVETCAATALRTPTQLQLLARISAELHTLYSGDIGRMLESPKKYRLNLRAHFSNLRRHPRALFVSVFLGTALATVAAFYASAAVVSLR